MVITQAHRREIYLKLADGSRLSVLDGPTMASEVEYIRSITATKPDEKWTHTDLNGHVHAYVRDADNVPRLPSLDRRSRHVECDGACGDTGCEGYEVTEWFCRECGEQVEPAFQPDYEAENPGIPVSRTTTFNLTVEMQGEPSRDPIEGAALEVVADDSEQLVLLPPLSAIEWEASAGSMSGPSAKVKLSGTRRDAVKRKPTGP